MKKHCWRIGTVFAAALAAAAGCGAPPHRYDHVVVVLEENHGYGQVLEGKGLKDCPYLNRLAGQGAVLTRSYAVTHPSLPNYLALFSGSTQGVEDDACAYSFSGPQLASELAAAGFSFRGYSEDLPSPGSTACNSAGKDGYYKKHNPWAYWQDSKSFPPEWSLPFSAFPPDYGALPTVAFVIPNEAHDMHEPNGYPPAADRWLEKNLDAYAQWAKGHNSLLVVTWDEDDFGKDNRIPTLLVGAGVKPGPNAGRTSHYGVLRTLEDMYGLKPLGESAEAEALRGVFE